MYLMSANSSFMMSFGADRASTRVVLRTRAPALPSYSSALLYAQWLSYVGPGETGEAHG